jgi:hypothetical protein
MFKIVNMAKVELVAIQGRGRGMSEFTANCLQLEIGQGVRISHTQYNKGKGVAAVYAAGNRRNMRFMVRRDVKGRIWLFRAKLIAKLAA